ncbi:transcriptional regulator DEF1-like [Cajanus cajan]|uniref:transcriptional regulator DEF1-like n=1 Tax=Cajanus cajan TaxID=3821 RepID=UPI00098DC1EE|nr:transcriptional regulator DEF1-like [Cajanus cajan]
MATYTRCNKFFIQRGKEVDAMINAGHVYSKIANACPSLQDSSTGPDAPQAYATNIYNNRPAQQQQQQSYDLSSNRYNPGWRNHPNLRCSNQQQQQQPNPPFQNNAGPSRCVPPPIQQQQQRQHEAPAPPAPQPQPSTSEPSLEELVRQMTPQDMQFQKETRASI